MTYILQKDKMSKKYRWSMVIDLDKCTGCQTCVIACKEENNIPFSSPSQSKMGRTIYWMEVMSSYAGEYPDVSVRHLPRPCMHCQNPPCVKVCPVGATFLGDDGIVGQIYPRCIGCRYCMNACPYNTKYFNWYKPEWPEEMRNSLNPDVTVRPKGVVEKCTFCHHRLQKAKDIARKEKRELKEGDYIPACMECCPANAIYFGNILDENSAVYKLVKGSRAFKLMDDLGTEPNVFYLSEGEWHIGKEEFSK